MNMISKVEFIDKNNVIRFYNPGEHEIKQIEGMRYLAFVSMGPVDDLNLYDEKYRLRHADLSRVISLASNEFVSKRPISVSRTETFVLFGARIEAVLFLIEQNADMTTFLAIK